MQRSSESIGTIAAALAKAQLELINPEKSLTGTIPGMTPRGDRHFRYAPLSTGLDLVRQTLGRHEIAIVQTTAIDESAALVRLTTVLAHSSGEWVSSEWPVCPVSETSSPQRMGTALTYARRYGLFTLVGIAGEDDLDAPDLGMSRQAAGVPVKSSELNAVPVLPGSIPPFSGSRKAVAARPVRRILTAEASSTVRADLESELARLSSGEEALAWAQRVLPTKNTLTALDARTLEQTFETKMAELGGVEASEQATAETLAEDAEVPASAYAKRVPAERLPYPKPRRRRDKKHLQYVASKPCLVCGRAPSDAHHLRCAEQRALGRKVSDEFTVPLCRIHHRQLHDRGDERAWWAEIKINPAPLAQQLWKETRAST